MDYHARFYDPALGRFVSADTLVPSPGNPQSLNRYSYCFGNPLRYVDPTGHEIEDYGPFVLENLDDWTEEQLEQLEETLKNHPFAAGWSGAEEIMIRRRDIYPGDDPYNPTTGGSAGPLDEDGKYEIVIYDVAWNLPPAMNGNKTTFKWAVNFQGTFAHELTHVVIYENPEMIDNYLALDADANDRQVGKKYGWDLKVKHYFAEDRAEEMIPISVAAYMYQRGALCMGPGCLLNWVATQFGHPDAAMYWQYGFVKSESSRLGD
jgi:hypothetical protein